MREFSAARSPSRRSLRLLAFALLAAVAGACSNPCDELIDRRCECGPAICRIARDELKLSTEVLRALGGGSAREVLAERCKLRLATFVCPKS